MRRRIWWRIFAADVFAIDTPVQQLDAYRAQMRTDFGQWAGVEVRTYRRALRAGSAIVAVFVIVTRRRVASEADT